MKNVLRLRAMGSLCRQQAAYNPAQSWQLLAKAEHWEHLAAVETSSYRAGPGCLNRISASISGASAGVRLPDGAAAG